MTERHGLEKVLYLGEVEKYFKTTRRTLLAWIEQGLPAFRIGSRWAVHEDDLVDFLREMGKRSQRQAQAVQLHGEDMQAQAQCRQTEGVVL